MTKTLTRWTRSLGLVLGLASGNVAWAQQSERLTAPVGAPPEAVWTPTADAPAGVMTPGLEGERHDRFIDRARSGDIDIVFFGSTATEMWLWQDRGRSVWDQTFGSLRVANFGTQGTLPTGLLWRMQNGELAGYQAKLVVLQTSGSGNAIPNDRLTELLGNYTAIIAEIRARQPEAKVLIFAPFPRGRLRREPWRQVADANAATFAGLADNETVFYVDIGERFFLPDGSYNPEMWRTAIVDPGIQTPAFEAWAEELEPWLDRFAR